MDPRLVWQRWTRGGKNSGDMASKMKYKLNTFAPASFEAKHVMNNADKASLAHYIVGEMGAEDASVNGSFPKGEIIQFIIDGYAQLYRLKWKKD